MEEELAAQMDEVVAEMTDELSAQLTDEVAQMGDKLAERSYRRRALRNAFRTESTADPLAPIHNASSVVTGGVGGAEYVGDMAYVTPPIENMKRYRAARRARRNTDEALLSEEFPVASYRRYRGRRNVDPLAVQFEDQALAAEEQALAMEEVARRSYRNGVRRGLRMTDEIGDATAPVIGEPVRRARRARRNTDEALLSEELPVASYRRYRGRRNVDETVMSDEEPTVASYRRYSRARRNTDPVVMSDEEAVMRDLEAARRYRAARRARRNTDEALLSDEEPTTASYRRYRARRNLEQPTMANEEAVMQDLEAARRYRAARRARRNTDEALLSDEEPTTASYRRYSRARRNTEPVMSNPYMSEEEAVMQDDLHSVASRRFRGKSQDFNNRVDYWRSKAMKAELGEAFNQRGFSGIGVTDVADRKDSYKNAFKSYLYQGWNSLSQTQQYVLKGKGTTNWGATKAFAGPGLDPRVKTYFGSSDSAGGFAVPPDWVSELNKNVMTQTVMAPECRTRTTTSDRIIQSNVVTTDARRAHAAVVRWPNEVIANGDVTRTTEDQFSQIEVPINVMMLSLTSSNSALEDVTFNLEEEINEAFSEAVAVSYDSLIYAGDGIGKLEGIVTNSQVTAVRSQGVQTVGGYVPTGSPEGIITADTLKEMFFHLPLGYRQRAKWYMNSNTGLQISTLKDGEGNYLIDQRNESLQNTGVPDRLFGKPIVYNEYAQDIAEDAFPIVLADLSRGYLIGKRVDFSIRRFDDSAYAELDQVLFLGRARIGGQVLQPAAIKVLKVAAS
jgi:HK97 family phage major capsid protein